MRYILVILLMMIVSVPTFASDPYWSNCDLIEAVTGMNDWKPEIKIGSLSDFDGKSYTLINGWLETPSPGYSYEIKFGDLVNDVQNISLKLITPMADTLAVIDADTLAVIDKVSVSERFESPKKIGNIVISIEKDFNWGPEIINCRVLSD